MINSGRRLRIGPHQASCALKGATIIELGVYPERRNRIEAMKSRCLVSGIARPLQRGVLSPCDFFMIDGGKIAGLRLPKAGCLCREGSRLTSGSLSKGKLLHLQRFLNSRNRSFCRRLIFGTLARVGLPYALYYKLSPWLGHPSMHRYATIEHLLVFAAFGALLSFCLPKSTDFHLLLGASGSTLAGVSANHDSRPTWHRSRRLREDCRRLVGRCCDARSNPMSLNATTIKRQLIKLRRCRKAGRIGVRAKWSSSRLLTIAHDWTDWSLMACFHALCWLARRSPQNTLINRLNLPPETNLHCYRTIRHTEFQLQSGRTRPPGVLSVMMKLSDDLERRPALLPR